MIEELDYDTENWGDNEVTNSEKREEEWEVFAYMLGYEQADPNVVAEEIGDVWQGEFEEHVMDRLLTFGDGYLPAGGYDAPGGLSPGWRREASSNLGQCVTIRDVIPTIE